MAFLGEYLVSFTGKSRLVIPKKIRESLGREVFFTLTKGYDGCLSGYKKEDWKKATDELMEESAITGRRMDLRRHIFSSAVEVEVDTQGRGIIPPNLMEYAGLTTSKDAIIIGVGNHFEIWDKNKWAEYQKIIENNINKEKDL